MLSGVSLYEITFKTQIAERVNLIARVNRILRWCVNAPVFIFYCNIIIAMPTRVRKIGARVLHSVLTKSSGDQAARTAFRTAGCASDALNTCEILHF